MDGDERIGENGMGVVWKALDETRLAASLSYARFVQVYEHRRHGDLDFIVMEYVEGQPLNHLLHGRPFPPEKSLTPAGEEDR
jgi:serine/threonine protein kinase